MSSCLAETIVAAGAAGTPAAIDSLPIAGRTCDVRVQPLGEGVAVFFSPCLGQQQPSECPSSQVLPVAGIVAFEGDCRSGASRLSPAAVRVLGGSGLGHGSGLTELAARVHPEDRPHRAASIAGALARGGEYAVQYRLAGADMDTVIWLEERGIVDLGLDGAPSRQRGLLIDITRRHLAEEAVGTSQRLLVQASRIARLGAWELDLESGAITWSEEIQGIFGFPAGARPLTYAAWRELLDPADRERHERALDVALRGEAEYTLEYSLRRPDGEELVLRCQAEVRRDLRGRPARMVGMVQDVTERVRGERAVSLVEARYRALALAAARIVWTCSPDGTRLFAPGWQALTGQGESDIQSRGWAAALHPEDADRTVATWAHALQHHTLCQVEFRLRMADGSYRWFADRGMPVVDPTGEVIEWVGVTHDIDDLKRGEQALRASEQRFRALVENGAVGLTLGDHSGRITYANEALLALLGYSAAEVESGAMRWDLLTPADELWRDHAAMEELDRIGHTAPWEKSYVAKDGRRVPVLIGVTILERGPHGVFGPGTLLSAFVLDLTERKRADAALRDSEERFRKLGEASFDGIDIVVDGIVREANQGFADMFGYDLHEVIGRPATDFVAEESLSDVRRRIADGLEGRYELVGKRRDGRRIPLEATAKTHEVDGRPGRITALRDLTERRSLEERYLQAQKMEAVGRLAGGVAHDFNNLLMVIRAIPRCSRGIKAGRAKFQKVQSIQQAADRAATLTRQLLAFSRKQLLELKVVDVNTVIGDMERLLRR